MFIYLFKYNLVADLHVSMWYYFLGVFGNKIWVDGNETLTGKMWDGWSMYGWAVVAMDHDHLCSHIHID